LKVLLVQWDEVSAAQRAAEIAAEGHQVMTESRDGAEAYRKARLERPDVVVLDLDHKASHSWQTARPLAKAKTSPTLVFVGGDEAARARAAREAPAATFVDPAALSSVLSASARGS
jgi:AmiR/NasT family two-component response regulator